MESIDKQISSKLRYSHELLGFIGGTVTSVTLIISKTNIVKGFNDKSALVGIDILNILVLILAIVAIKPIILTLTSSEIRNIQKHLADENTNNLETILLRVNELTRQLVYCIKWFCAILGLFYILQLFIDSIFSISYDEVKPIIDNSRNLLELLSRASFSKVDLNEIYIQINKSSEGNLQLDIETLKLNSAKYLTTEIFLNTTNLFSDAYLFLAFQVLFLVTLDKDNKTWRFRSYTPFVIAVLITVVNILIVIIGYSNSKLSHISHLMRLLGGIYNGVAMLLLFSRLLSMEYFFKNSKAEWQRLFYLYGTLIVLPLYVIAQPLYGLFNAVEVGNSAELFKSIVFLVCFWGKLIFLLFVYTMLSNKWIHSYLFMVLSQKNTIYNIAKEAEEIIDLANQKDL